MATIINPITTVLLSRAELTSGEFDRFPFKYILESDGTISYFSKLSAGRYLLSHEAKVPGLGTSKTTVPPIATIQPLAEGRKIPREMFDQVRQFFLDVMDMGPATYEAQIFIVWSLKEQTYRIIVPKQEVSAAAVKYDIGEMLTDDDVIIVDIHSHNDMGAFFSGTDNADDKKNPWISGVFGKLSTMMENKFRFNDGSGRHFDMKIEDVFDFSEETVTTPREWLDQVQIRTYTAPVKYAGGAWRGYQPARSAVGNPVTTGAWNDCATSSYQGGLDTFLDDPESDLYDNIVDSLRDSDDVESRNVLSEAESFLKDNKHIPTLTDREMQAYIEVNYAIHTAKDDAMAERVVMQLLCEY